MNPAASGELYEDEVYRCTLSNDKGIPDGRANAFDGNGENKENRENRDRENDRFPMRKEHGN